MRLPRPWEGIAPDRARRLEAELAREVPQVHVLAGKGCSAIGIRADRDDVLFEVDGSGYAVVHLTWRQREETSPGWPLTEIYASLTDVPGADGD